jgi:hypothetical protein
MDSTSLKYPLSLTNRTFIQQVLQKIVQLHSMFIRRHVMGICVCFLIGDTQKACLYFYKRIQKLDFMYL